MPGLLDKRLIFVTGKGGVGKSTVAASLGLAAAARGKRVMVVEVAQQERVSRAFKREGVGYEETELRPGFFGFSVDPQAALEEYLAEHLPGPLTNLVFHNRIFQLFAVATPGMRELVTIGKVWELAQLERRTAKARPYDLVIMDAPATGHGLGILRTPKTFRDATRVGPVARRAALLHDFITDPRKTGVAVVALPEEMPVTETLEFREQLKQDMGMKIDQVVVNGVYPERFTGPEAERIGSLDGRLSPAANAAVEAALLEHGRARAHRVQLRRLRKELQGGPPVTTLPFLFEPELGLDAFERLGRELGRRL